MSDILPSRVVCSLYDILVRFRIPGSLEWVYLPVISFPLSGSSTLTDGVIVFHSLAACGYDVQLWTLSPIDDLHMCTERDS